MIKASPLFATISVVDWVLTSSTGSSKSKERYLVKESRQLLRQIDEKQRALTFV